MLDRFTINLQMIEGGLVQLSATGMTGTTAEVDVELDAKAGAGCESHVHAEASVTRPEPYPGFWSNHPSAREIGLGVP